LDEAVSLKVAGGSAERDRERQSRVTGLWTKLGGPVDKAGRLAGKACNDRMPQIAP